MAVTKSALTTTPRARAHFERSPDPNVFWGRGLRPPPAFTGFLMPLLKPSRTDFTEDVVGSIIASLVTSS